MKTRQLLILFVLCLLYGGTANAQDWTLTNGPSGERVRSILVDGTDLYVIGKTVIRSTNSGSTWQQIVLPVPNGTPKYIQKQSDGDVFIFISYVVETDSIWHTMIEGDDTTRMFMYTRENLDKSGLYRSSNAGATWDHVFRLDNTNTMLIDSHDRIMFTTESKKQYTSTDDGVTWDSSVTVPEWTSAIFEDASGDLFLTSSRAVHRSTTGGESWSKILNGLPDGQYYSFASDLGGRHFTTSNVGGTFMSTDDGRSWASYQIAGKNAYSSVARNASGTLLAGNRYDTLYWISTDNGDTWNSVPGDPLAMSYSGNDVYKYVAPTIGGASNDFYSGGFYGLWHITPSLVEEVSAPLGAVTGLIALSTGTLVAATTFTDFQYQDLAHALWRSTNEGASWSRIQTLTGQFGNDYHMAMDSAGNGYINIWNSLMRTSDDGFTWQNSGTVINPMTPATGLAVGADGTIYVSTNGEYMLRSTDDGLSWDQLNHGLTEPKLTSIAVSPNNDVYVSSSSKIFRSTDAGLNWSATTFTSTDPVTVLVVSPQGRILAGTKSGGVLSSIDDGATWTSSGSGLNTSIITRMLSTPSGKIIAGTDDGVFVLNPGSDVWAHLSAGLTNPAVISLTRALDGRVYAGTDGTGVFKSSQMYNIMNAAVDQPTVAAFGVIVTDGGLRFTGLEAGKHEVSVLDILGRTVIETTINNDRVQLPELSSGAYFVKIGDRVVAFTL